MMGRVRQIGAISTERERSIGLMDSKASSLATLKVLIAIAISVLNSQQENQEKTDGDEDTETYLPVVTPCSA